MSTAIFKYKPKLVTTGTVVKPPQHTNHRHTQGDADGELSGYRVMVRWWNPFRLQWHVLKPFVSPSFDTRRVMALFPPDQRIFFTFVMYDREPKYLRAIGPMLGHWDVKRMQRTFPEPDLLPSIDRLRDAGRWEEGEIHPLFPYEFSWSAQRFCVNSQYSRLIIASRLLGPERGWKPVPGFKATSV